MIKTMITNRQSRPVGQPCRRQRATTTLVSVLLLSAVNLTAAPVVTTISGGPSAGYRDGDTTLTATFHTPIGLALDSSGNFLFVADRDNNAIRVLDFDGNLTSTFATYPIRHPVGVALDSLGNVFVLNFNDGVDGSVVEFDSTGNYLTTLVTGLPSARGIALDSLNNVYVTANNDTILQITSDGTQIPVATIQADANGAPVLQGIAVTSSGYLAISDSGRNGILVVNPTTGTVTNLTGFNGAGDRFGSRTFAKFNDPRGIAASGGGVLIVADFGNNRVKIVDSIGTVTNLYGVNSNYWVAKGFADGTVCRGDTNYNVKGCVEARRPAGVVFASDGTIYTTEDYYHLIRKVTGATLPLPPPPPPAVPAPAIGWVDFQRNQFDDIVSVLRVGSSFVFNNDVTIAIQGTDGTETHYTFGPTPTGVDTIPDPSPTVGSTPPTYRDGLFPSQVPPSIVAPQPDVTIKAIGFASGRSNSPIVAARFQFRTGAPVISGDNAASFTITNQTVGAQMWYTLDGTTPTNAAPSIGPILSGTTLSFNIATNFTFKIRGFRLNYQPSDVVSQEFSITNFNATKISFGFASGEASSDFVSSPGQLFYAPVTLTLLPGTKMYSLQFNLTVTNAGPNPGPAVAPGAVTFESFLEKPDPRDPGTFIKIPPAMFLGGASNSFIVTNIVGTNIVVTTNSVFTYPVNPPPANLIFSYAGNPGFLDLSFVNTSLNLIGVGWLERLTRTNLYDTMAQDLITFSQPHDTTFLEENGNVVVGGYAFSVPVNAAAGQTYQIQIGRPSATSDGIGAPGSDVYIATPTNGSLAGGPVNSIKTVTVGQRKYIAGDVYPFRWFNAGDFGKTNLVNADVMQVFQSAVYTFNYPPAGSDFFDGMDSCGGTYIDLGHGYLEFNTSLAGNPAALNALFSGDDTTINQVAFGDGVLDVCDIYVTFRRSLDPSLVWFRRFWTNGVRVAEIVGNPPPPQTLSALALTNPPSVNFASTDLRASAGQTVQVPISAQVFGNYPLRLATISLSVDPLPGSPALTSPVQFTPNPALGQPTIAGSSGTGNYAATWLNRGISGFIGAVTLGTLTLQVPASASSTAAYAIHFDHASASPNGLASLPKRTLTGLITLSDRSASSYNDGIPDSWRLRYFGSLENLLSQASADADGDGINNWQEYVAGTDPTDPKSCLRASTVRGAAPSAQDCVIRWPSVSGKTYVIERSATLFGPNWIPVSTNSGTGSDMQFHDVTGGNVRFYRVRVQ
jgi:hypothetical protein